MLPFLVLQQGRWGGLNSSRRAGQTGRPAWPCPGGDASQEPAQVTEPRDILTQGCVRSCQSLGKLLETLSVGEILSRL